MAAYALLDRPIYEMSDVDRLLALPSGTARRWIDGYRRSTGAYPPVIRPETTGSSTATWGEFVETRLLAGYRRREVSLQRLRPAVERLRAEFGRYPLAHAEPFLDVAGQELVRRVQDDVGLARELQIVVVRNGQQMLAPPAQDYVDSARFGHPDRTVVGLRPSSASPDVSIDPLRQTGRPVIRSVPTEVLAEQFRAGESATAIADLFSLTTEQVEQALRFELQLAEARAA